MNKLDLLNSTLNELAKDIGESLEKLQGPLLEKIHEVAPHMNMLEIMKLSEKFDSGERERRKAMFATRESSRAKQIIAFLEENNSDYFTLKKAQDLIRTNFRSLSDSQLQKKFVMLRDFERYVSNTDVYRDILLKGGYFVSAATHASTGLTPKDIWLIQNLRTALDDATAERNARMKRNPNNEAWSDISVMGGNTGDMPMEPLKVEQDKTTVNRPKDGKDLDTWIKGKKAPNDTGPVYSGKEFENEKITQEGNLVHKETGNPVPQLYVGSVQTMNGFPEKSLGKPIKFLGRRIWAFSGRGYGHEVEVEGQYGVLSLNGATDKPGK